MFDRQKRVSADPKPHVAVPVVLGAEPIELALLRRKVTCRWPSRLGFEGSMHAFMAAVLLRFAGFDEFRQHAETNPPGRERRQARERVGGEWHAVIGADALG